MNKKNSGGSNLFMLGATIAAGIAGFAIG